MIGELIIAVLLGFSGVLSFLIPVVLHDHGAEWYISRNIYHMMIFSSAAAAPLVLRSIVPIAVASSTSLLLLILYYLVSGSNAVSRFYEIMRRENVSPSERGLYTVITVILLLILAAITWDQPLFFTTGMLVMAYGDALGEIVGRRRGEIEFEVTSTKTLTGSLTVFGVGSGVIISVTYLSGQLDQFTIPYLLGLGLLAMIIEAVSFKFLDNVMMPAATALLLKFPLTGLL